MWFGTQAGLNQYDGYTFRIYQNNPLDSSSISDGNINAIVEDSSGNVWIGTSEGLNRLDQNQNRFEQYRADVNDSTTLANNSVLCLHVDSKKRLWVGTISGIGLYDKATNCFRNLLIGYDIKIIFEDSQEALWIGTGFDGLFRFDPDQNQFKQFLHDSSDPNSIGSNNIEAIVEDAQSHLWIGTIDGGLNLYDRVENRFIVYRNDPNDDNSLPANTIYTLLFDRAGHLWVGFENAGLACIKINYIDKPLPSHLPYMIYRHEPSKTNSLSNNTIRSLFEDRQGNLWIGTFSGGVNLLCRNRKQFVNYHNEPFNEQGLGHNIVQTLLEDRSGHVWIGTDGGGLNDFDPENGSFKKYMHRPGFSNTICSNHVLDLCEDALGNLWVATWEGLNYFDLSKKHFVKYGIREGEAYSLTSDKITCVLKDSRNNLWVGTVSGLNLFDEKSKRFYRVFQGAGQDLGNKYVQCLYEDRSGNLWVGTVWGLYRLRSERSVGDQFEFEVYFHEDDDSASLSDNHVFSIVEDNRGFIWIATLSGLNCYDPDHDAFASYTTLDGLATNWISSVVEDHRGSLWMGTHKGISKFDPTTGVFNNYDIHDGLMSHEFTRGVLRSRTGELYFGGKTGFTRFHPDSIKANDYMPPVVLTDFRVLNRFVPLSSVKGEPSKRFGPVQHSIELSYKQNVFSFEFAALDYTAPEKNQYRYKLEGFDPEWRSARADRRFVTYTNLPGGEYLFRVQGSNSDGIWNEAGLSVALKILPPFWKTKWALLLYIGVTFGVLMLLRELIVYREKLKTEIRIERKEAEKVHELDEMKLRFFTNISHEFRTPLSIIIGLLEKMMRFKGPLRKKTLFQNYHILFRNAKRLLRLINQIMDIRKLDAGQIQLDLKKRDIVYFVKSIYTSFKYQAEQRHIRYRFKSNIDRLSIWFDPDKIDKIIYNVLSNAFKFTENGGTIQVHLLIISDTTKQEGALPETGTTEEMVSASGHLEIQIQDSGIGIPDQFLDKIYDPFFQIENEANPTSKGTGIGLALTRELVALHHGSIGVKSEPGSGSCFVIKIPLNLFPEKVRPDQQVAVETEPTPVIPEAGTGMADSMLHSLNSAAPLILIVDDEIDFCNYLRDELTEEYRVIEASDGEEALKMVLEWSPDLIVSDVKMPKMDGFALCSKLKKNIQTLHIPIILLTSQIADRSRIDGFDLGADDYLEKPFDVNLLKVRIANLIQSRNQLKDKFSHEIYLQPRNVTVTPEDERFLSRVVQIVEEHIEDCDFHVSRLGSEVGLSRVQLYRKIKTLTDLTPNDLMKDLRLKRAAQLLEKSQLTVFEIAYGVGFKDPSYFCKCFRHQYGTSPAEYARACHIKVSPNADSASSHSVSSN